MKDLEKIDPNIYEAIQEEWQRQKLNLEMIASENYASSAVMQAQGSILTNKYAEGYPGRRYYNGCDNIDTIEKLGIQRLKEIFSADHANIQPHSGSQANMACYFSCLKPGDSILGMELSHGGHLTHGCPVNFSGFIFKAYSYGLSSQDHRLDFNQIESLAKKYRPRLIIAGHSSYPRQIDFQSFKDIADQVRCPLLVDMAHISGLVAGGEHPSPIPYADFVTSTTHKTLRGPRGGFILCKNSWSKKVDSGIFPGTQGGPLPHVMAAKAISFHEAQKNSFKGYIRQVIKNSKTLARNLIGQGYDLVTGGTDNHIVLIDLTKQNVTGKEIANALDAAGITVNKNTVPYDKRSPFVTSGIRMGTAALTTRGMKESEMEKISQWIHQVIYHKDNVEEIEKIKKEVQSFCKDYPLFQGSI